MSSERSSDRSLALDCAHAVEPVLERNLASSPFAFAIDGVTPRELQLARGTCWIFAAVAVLEHSYRQQGIARGWLKPNQYLRLSEQAFGIAVLDLCTQYNATCGQMVGHEIWSGGQMIPLDTEGGQAYLLYYLHSLGAGMGALPWSVCPYQAQPGSDDKCDGLDAARKTNPLRFTIRSMRTFYERQSVKETLRQGRALALSTSMVTVRYLLPCTARSADILNCDPDDADQCVACPIERAFANVPCCIESEREMVTMEGSFFRLPAGSYPEPINEGGHAMTVVGYSDHFRTRHGYVGGFILKNSWWDGLPPAPSWKHARGSHSIAYFTQTISAEDEARICPNSHSPRSWVRCDDLEECRSKPMNIIAARDSKPLNLVCIDSSPFLHGLCRAGERFFLKSLQRWEGDLYTTCFLRDAEPHASAKVSAAKSGKPLCIPPVPLEDLALVFAPIEEERRPNHPDLCGFYFFPYELLESINAETFGFQVNDMHVEWAQEAYAFNSEQYSKLNYTLVNLDTYTQESPDFRDPVPFPISDEKPKKKKLHP